jgi:2-polyprenyl-6-methoxyphenol hydroxylase-like FAD-dependent oxidoreductase
VIHAHTLEVLEELGVSERLAEDGLRLTRFSIRDRDSVLVRLRFDQLPTAYAYLLMLPQDRTEKILAEALTQAHGAVRWGCSVESLVEARDGVEATLLSPAGRETVRARYVVGADGMTSLVRRTAGIGFTGSTYEESFVLADVDMNWSHGREEVMLYFSPAGLVVVAPLPGGAFRIVATLDDAPEQPGVADIQALLDARGPTRGVARVCRVHWSSRFRLHHRVADAYRRGPFLLVGDAAHVHSPAGGQGMNTGLVDACVLGRLLAEVLSGREEDAYLDRYEALRRPAAQQVLALAGRLTGMATTQGAARRTLRNFALRAMGRLPAARRRLEMNLSGLSRRGAAMVSP